LQPSRAPSAVIYLLRSCGPDRAVCTGFSKETSRFHATPIQSINPAASMPWFMDIYSVFAAVMEMLSKLVMFGPVSSEHGSGLGSLRVGVPAPYCVLT